MTSGWSMTERNKKILESHCQLETWFESTPDYCFDANPNRIRDLCALSEYCTFDGQCKDIVNLQYDCVSDRDCELDLFCSSDLICSNCRTDMTIVDDDHEIRQLYCLKGVFVMNKWQRLTNLVDVNGLMVATILATLSVLLLLRTNFLKRNSSA